MESAPDLVHGTPGTSPRPLDWPATTTRLRPSGTPRPVLGERFGYLDGDAFAGRELEHEVALYRERLRALSEELLRVEERERSRLSIDLHDGLSQTIVLVKLKLGALRKSTDPRLSKSVQEIEQLIDQANQSVRSITVELHPTALDEQDLGEAARWLAEHLGARYGIEIRVEDDGLPKALVPNHKAILFRSIRELLINAAKHARARRILVRMERGERCVIATVSDDGVGMKGGSARGWGFGLSTIRECLTQLGGSMQIESRPAHGTTVWLRAPLAKPRAARTGAT